MQEATNQESAMAGADVLISSLKEGRIPLCQDGLPLEPLDYLSLLFPNKGPNATGNNVCFAQKRFQIPSLRKLLPEPTKYFTPDDFVDSIACSLLLCLLIFVGLLIVKYVWEKLDSNFASIKPSHKKWYVVANVSKALFLAVLSLSHRYWLGTYRLYFYDQFQTLEVKRCGVIYVATDAVALLMVPKLPRSTIIHHVATITLVGIVCTMNLDVEGWDGLLGVTKMAVLYAIFSTVAFSVNAYLALRVVYPKAAWLNWLVKVSLCTYLLCCACNWTIHLVWFFNLIVTFQYSIYNLLYSLVIAFIIHDDVVLIKWLLRKSSPGANEEEAVDKE